MAGSEKVNHPVANLPRSWKPRHRDDLIRLGSKNDGGYVVTENIVGHTDFLVGLGVGTDWTFEEDFHKRYKCSVHCYDHTISAGQLTVNSIRSAQAFIRRPSMDYIRRISLSKILRPLKYKLFFSGDRKHFVEMIGDNPDHYTNFGKIFSRIPAKDKVFIKMDIEGWEYRALTGLSDYYDRLTGLTVEFHNLDTMLDTVRSHVSELAKSFDIVHVHLNNFLGTDERGIPCIIEMTFESKALSPGMETESRREYPVDGLDSPNLIDRADYKLEFRD